MKIYPKTIIIPCYIIWLTGMGFLTNWMNNTIPQKDIEGVAQGFAVFFLFTLIIPYVVGDWLHRKLFPKFYEG